MFLKLSALLKCFNAIELPVLFDILLCVMKNIALLSAIIYCIIIQSWIVPLMNKGSWPPISLTEKQFVLGFNGFPRRITKEPFSSESSLFFFFF